MQSTSFSCNQHLIGFCSFSSENAPFRRWTIPVQWTSSRSSFDNTSPQCTREPSERNRAKFHMSALWLVRTVKRHSFKYDQSRNTAHTIVMYCQCFGFFAFPAFCKEPEQYSISLFLLYSCFFIRTATVCWFHLSISGLQTPYWLWVSQHRQLSQFRIRCLERGNFIVRYSL